MEKAGNGLKTAVDLVMAAMPGAAPQEPEQIDLEDYLGLPARAIPATPADSAGAPRRGRPAGSRNKRTVQWAEYLLSRYASPLEVLAQIAVARVDDLKSQLDCNGLEALQEKRHAAIALAPFLHQRQPLALNISERKVVYLTIQADSSPPLNAEPDTITLEAQIIPNQGLTQPKALDVEREQVEREAQAIDNNGELSERNGIESPMTHEKSRGDSD